MFDKLLEEINKREVVQEAYPDGFVEDIYQILEELHISHESIKMIGTNSEPDKHRWYELVDYVFEFEGRFMQVSLIDTLYSESSYMSDISHKIKVCEVFPKEIVKTIYVTTKE